MLKTALAVALLCVPLTAHAVDPYSCFGAMRYVAMREGYSCGDLVDLCARARSIYIEAGRNKAAAARLAKERGHSDWSILLANTWCKP